MLSKNSGTALILSIILGLFSFCGIGQLYVGRVGRGVAILIVGWVLLAIGVVTMGIGLLLYLGFFIWQAYDTNELCKKYNHMLSTSGQPPW
jgi:TM2 domain-containing membrane protein YozV